MVRNFYRKKFCRQQNFIFRKVPIKKMRFEPQIDIIDQKLTHVASGEVGEFLIFAEKKTYAFWRGKK